MTATSDGSARRPLVAAGVDALARLAPVEADPSEELARSLALLGSSLSARTVVRAGYGAGLLVGALAVPAGWLAGLPPTAATLAAVAAGLAASHAVHAVPVGLATMRRTSALGAAPDLVGRAVLRMRVAPSVESAAGFAAETGTGPLADSLAAHVRRARGTPRSGLAGFAAEWADWFPALRRAALLVEAAAEAPPGERARTLDRALDAVLDGTRERMATFANDVQGPATAVYAFGVLLPLALVGVLPAAGAAGLPASVPAVWVLYGAVLPAGLAWAAWRRLARRPVAFRPPAIPADHPELRSRRWPAVALAGGAAAGGWLAGAALVGGWAGPLLAAGWGSGAPLLWWYRPARRVRDRVRALEEGLPDALYLVGRRVADGAAVEAAVDAVADEVPEPTAGAFADAARRSRQLRVGPRRAFRGEHGPLATLPSPRARATADLLAAAAREGRPAGEAAVAMADHLEDLLAVERDARRSLARVTETLRSTALAFGPLVGGSTVALADGVAAERAVDAFPVAGLGLAVGWYVLALAALLTVLSVGLSRGLDRALVGYRCGLALAVAPTVYLGTYLLSGAVV